MKSEKSVALICALVAFSVIAQPSSDWEAFEMNGKQTIYINKNIKLNNGTAEFSTLHNFDKVQTIRSLRGLNDQLYKYKSRVDSEFIDCGSRMRSTNGFDYFSEQNGTGYLVFTFNASHLPFNYEWNKVFPPYYYSQSEWSARGFEKKFCKKVWEVWR